MSFVEKPQSLQNIEIEASEYWDTHHVFGKPSTKRNKRLGEVTVRSILINSVVPFAVFLAAERSDAQLKEAWIENLKPIDPEQNSVTRKFEDVGFNPENAFTTQGLLQLHGNYCAPRNCVNCAVGSAILKRN